MYVRVVRTCVNDSRCRPGPSRRVLCFNMSKIAVMSRFRSLTVQRYDE